jgi:crotonobetainyl-CoA:carnitine CoA-transferase CaiB-like acyl-CoA transferase
MHRGGWRLAKSYNDQPAWFQLNRNKYSIALDLRRPRDHSFFSDLVQHSDVVANNSRLGVMDRLGIGRPALLALKPDLITIAMTAYGETGPHASRPAYGGSLEAVSGMQVLTGYTPHGKSQRIRELDVVNGIGGACAIMAALIHRERTGQGQHIDLSQLEFSTFSLIGEHLLEFVANGSHTQPLGNRNRKFAPQGCYPCRDADQWVTLTVVTDKQWQRLCDLIGASQWKRDARFVTAAGRHEYHSEIDHAIATWTRNHNHYKAMQILQSLAIPSGAVLTSADLASDPHLKARGYFVDNPAEPTKKMMGLPFKLAHGGGAVRWQGPDLGADTARVARDKLGRAEADAPTFVSDEIGTAYDAE